MSARTRLGIVMALAAALLPAAQTAGMSDRYWIGSGNWSEDENWALTSGGSEATTAPGADDTAIFDDNGVNNATIDAAFDGAIGAIDIRSGYTGTITQSKTVTVNGAFSLAESAIWRYTLDSTADLTVQGNMTVHGTIQCQRTSTDGEGTGRSFTVVGNLTIGANGIVTADHMGFAARGGPGGGGTRHWGGAYGGGSENVASTYGDYKAPIALGSGGYSGPGGGAVSFFVSGAMTNNGVVSVRGEDGAEGRGSGGSIYVAAGSLAGDGEFRAHGGASGSTGSGGGGRIALVVTNAGANFALIDLDKVTAYGGPSRKGAAGTIYLERRAAEGAGNGTLIVKNDAASARAAATYIPAGQTWTPTSLVVTNHGMVAIRTDTILNLKNIVSGTPGATAGIRLQDEGVLNLPDGFIEIENWQLILDGDQTLDGNIFIRDGGVITHSAGADAFKMHLTLNGNLVVDSGGAVSAVGKGSTGGPGGGTRHEGACHGGMGGGALSTATTYGSLIAPTTLGSGLSYGSRPGGGAIRLSVSGVVTNNGDINASGLDGSEGRSAGGSLYIVAGALDGNGYWRANGGASTTTGSGGGGRVALVVTNAGANFAGIDLDKVTAFGGDGTRKAAAGTVYLRTAGQGPQDGLLIVDNNNIVPYAGEYTLISTQVVDTAVSNVVIRNNGRLRVAADQTLTVYGSWSNAATVACHAEGTVAFAGLAVATLSGAGNFGILECTTPGKTLRFEAGATNTVSGLLDLAGGEGNLLILQSTTPGARWGLTMLPGSLKNVSYVHVTDSEAGGGDPIPATDSTNGGNNSNWIFGAEVITWTGEVDSQWNNTENWDLGRLPTSLDTVMIPATANDPILDAYRELDTITNETGAVFYLNGNSLLIGGTLRNAGTIAASGTETLTCLGDVDFTDGSFTAALSTIELAGNTAQSVALAGNAFHRIRVSNTDDAVTFPDGFAVTKFESVSAGATLRFGADKTFDMTDFNVLGAVGNAVTLRSTVNGTAWRLNVPGLHTVRYVDARDSDASGGRGIYAVDSTDATGNSNWDFGAWHVWTGTASGDFGNAGNWNAGTAPGENDRVFIDGHGANAPIITQTTRVARLTVGLSSATTLTVDGQLDVLEDLCVHANGVLTHSDNGMLRIDGGGDVLIEQGGAINATGKSTLGLSGGGARHGGAAHGGLGGDHPVAEITYGSAINPTTAGGAVTAYGAARRGGGVIRLSVTGTIHNHGAIEANGSDGDEGRGAGGSVNIVAGAVAGNGQWRANGGIRTGQTTRGGGGGRLALRVTDPGADFVGIDLGQVTACGGSGGAAGTVYLQTAGQNTGYGMVIINNADQTTASRTHLPPSHEPVLDELRYASVIVTNRGALAVTAGDRLGSLTVVSANEPLDLGPVETVLEVGTLIVHGTAYTKAGLYTAGDWNGFPTPANVTGDGGILITAGGSLFLLR